MSMKDLLGGDCGQQNPVLRVASHFAGSGSSDSPSIAPVNIAGLGRSSQHHSNQVAHGLPRGPAEVLLPPTTFRMDSLLKEIQSLDRSHGPTQAPRVVDLTLNEDWVQEFQSNDGIDHQKWAEEFHTLTNSPLDLDRTWDASASQHPPNFHPFHPQQCEHPQNQVLESAKDILEDSKWAEEFDQQSKTELMTTAEEFIQSISDPSIKATEFMSFVEKLSTGEATVKNTPQSQAPDQWVNEFETDNVATPRNDQTWADEFVGGTTFEANSEEMSPMERQELWTRLQSEWEKAADEVGLHPWLTEGPQQFRQPYKFEEQNPYEEVGDPLEEGKKRLMVSDIPAAAQLFEAAVQKNPENPEAWYLLGTTQALNEQDPQAISALLKCTELEPGNLKAHLALAASLTNESYYLQACRALKTWLKQNPEYSELVPENVENPVHTSLLSNSELSTVQNLFMKAARKRPAQNLDADVQCGLGILFNLNSDYNKAGDCFRAAVNADPQNALLWNRLGATLANGGEAAEAIGAYSKALDIIPGSIRTRFNLGVACVHLGSYREAAGHFLSALNMQASSSGRANATNAMNHVSVKNAMSDSIWTSLRMVVHLLDKGKLSSAIDRRDLATLNQEFS